MRLVRLLLGLLVAALLVAGCGGGSGGRTAKGRGRTLIRFVWPTPSRMVPGVATHVNVKIFKGTSIVSQTLNVAYEKTLEKPATGSPQVSVAAVDLDAGDYVVQARATKGASGPIVAQGTSPLPVTAGNDANFTVTMDSALTRYKVTDIGVDVDPGPAVDIRKAFDPPEFTIDANGVVGGTPTYKADRDSTTLIITPQSATSDLLLLPTGSTGDADEPRIEFQVTGGGLDVDGGTGGKVALPSTVQNGGYKVLLTHAPSADSAAILRLDYYDYVYSDDVNPPTGGFQVSLVRSFSAAVGVGSTSSDGFTITVSGLPADMTENSGRHRESYRLRATLRENAAGGEPGATYPGTEVVDPETGRKKNALSFGNVNDRGRGFQVEVTLQLRTEGGGYVDYATMTRDVEISTTTPPEETFVVSEYASVTIPGTATTPDQTIRLVRGQAAAVTGVKATLSKGTTVLGSYLLDPALFTPTPKDATGDNGIAVTVTPANGAPPVVWTVRASNESATTGSEARSAIKVKFKGFHPDVEDADIPSNDNAIAVFIAPNGGSIGVKVG